MPQPRLAIYNAGTDILAGDPLGRGFATQKHHVLAAGTKVHGVLIPADTNVSTSYPIGVVTASKEQTTAAAFVAYVLSPAGSAALTAAGFGPA